MTELKWIEHTPGECPVPPDTLVRLRFRHGRETLFARAAGDWPWDDQEYGTITEYAIVEAPAEPTGPTAAERAFWQMCAAGVLAEASPDNTCLAAVSIAAAAADAMLAEAIKRGMV